MELFLLAIVLVGFCVFALCFNIVFKKDGKFPDGEISHNKALTKQGIQCAKVEERILWRKKKTRGTGELCPEDACAECSGSCSITDN